VRFRRANVPGASYFFTLVTQQRRRYFLDQTNVDRWNRAVEKVRRARPFAIEAGVVMPDHLLVIWTLPDGDSNYATRIRLIKTAFAKSSPVSSDGEITERRASKSEREVWQRSYWEHVIADERDFLAHVDYIHINPIAHRLVERPGDWRHSTFLQWVERGSYDPWWGSNQMPPLPDCSGQE
jgi:putative transposase